jgi:hypothetical protein
MCGSASGAVRVAWRGIGCTRLKLFGLRIRRDWEDGGGDTSTSSQEQNHSFKCEWFCNKYSNACERNPPPNESRPHAVTTRKSEVLQLRVNEPSSSGLMKGATEFAEAPPPRAPRGLWVDNRFNEPSQAAEEPLAKRGHPSGMGCRGWLSGQISPKGPTRTTELPWLLAPL